MSLTEHHPRAPAARPQRRLAVALATGFGVGFLPRAPGTFGALLALPIYIGVRPWPAWLLLLSALGLFALGVWAAEHAGAHFGVADDARIVVDEIFGQLLATAPLFAVPVLTATPALSPRAHALALVTAFVLFRCLDIAKPGPVGWAERNFRGGLGVMLDDTVAGALAAVATAALLLSGALG